MKRKDHWSSPSPEKVVECCQVSEEYNLIRSVAIGFWLLDLDFELWRASCKKETPPAEETALKNPSAQLAT
jgi:hypothetical protein